ncbi:MAG: response regulator [Kineosporiaceae bacterium]
MNAELISVLVADDHPIFREGLRMLIDSVEGIRVVGEAATTGDAVRLAEELRPDVVVMDLHMPNEGGAAATARILGGHPETGVLVLTMLDDGNSLVSAVRAGARGYLLKGAGRADVVAAIREVDGGGSAFGPGVTDRVLGALLDRARHARPFPELTEREHEVLDLVAAGHRNPVIAQRLRLSPKTVRNLVSAAMIKLRAADRTALALMARERGLGADEGRLRW